METPSGQCHYLNDIGPQGRLFFQLLLAVFALMCYNKMNYAENRGCQHFAGGIKGELE